MNIIGTFVNNGEYSEVHDVETLIWGPKLPQTSVTPQASMTAETQKKSNVHLSRTNGMKIDFIRVVNALCELGFFQNEQGGKITKKEIFTAIGEAVNIDLKDYYKDLSRSTTDSTALEKHLRVFDDMRQKMIDIFNSK